MRYEHRRGSGDGEKGRGARTGEKKRDGENRMREQEKKKPDEVTERGGRRGTDGPAVLTLTRPEVEVG